jgi:16S rRNA (guanine966-N2)-methyltransferase
MRVIAGRLRGRTLRAPRGTATRPTADRVREALFSMLGDVSGLVVLDLYAGSGALGIEALSRGARRAVFVESNRAALDCLRRNVNELGVGDACRVIGARSERAAPRLKALGPFGLVLCDPPWAALDRALSELGPLLESIVLSRSAVLVVEHPRGAAVELAGWVLTSRRAWGGSAISLFAGAAGASAPDASSELAKG